ncbi:MAG: hypothetical protein EOP50_21860, partial [Sphingobacteriales bacterium]
MIQAHGSIPARCRSACKLAASSTGVFSARVTRRTLVCFGSCNCIIGVLSTVQSLEHNLQNEIKSLGSNTIYIDKWDYNAGGGPDYPWWKYVNRPSPRIGELAAIKQRTPSAGYACFVINAGNESVQVGGKTLSGVTLYGITEEFPYIQAMEVQYGRGLSDAEYGRGTATAVIGNEIAEKMFLEPEMAVGSLITVRGRKCTVIGVIKKQGKS